MAPAAYWPAYRGRNQSGKRDSQGAFVADTLELEFSAAASLIRYACLRLATIPIPTRPNTTPNVISSTPSPTSQPIGLGVVAESSSACFVFKQGNDDGRGAGCQSIFEEPRSQASQKTLVAGLRALYSRP